MGFIVSVVVSLRCLPLHNRVSYLLKDSILRGSFNNYVDQIVISWQYFANFDPSTPSEDNCGHFTWYLPVMSPSRAEGFSARLGSWPFFIQLEIKNWPKKSLKCLIILPTAGGVLADFWVPNEIDWEGFTLAVCLVLKSGCSDESLLIKFW